MRLWGETSSFQDCRDLNTLGIQRDHMDETDDVAVPGDVWDSDLWCYDWSLRCVCKSGEFRQERFGCEVLREWLCAVP